MAALPSWRTEASSGLVAIVASFQIHNQFDCVRRLIHGHMHLINHLSYQEQAPAARGLQPSQLGFQVRNLCWQDGFAPTLVGDAHGQRTVRYPYVEIDRHVRVSARALSVSI